MKIRKLLFRNLNRFRMSYIKGESYPPLTNLSVSQLFESTAKKFPDRPAIICHRTHTKLSWEEVYKEATKIAGNLLDLGLKKGDRVGIYSPNNIEWYLSHIACSLADLIMVTINPAYRLEELIFCLNQTQISTIIAETNHQRDTIINNFLELLSNKHIENNLDLKLNELPHLKNILVIDSDKTKKGLIKGLNWFDEILQNHDPSPKSIKKIKNVIHSQNCKDATNIQFTSGTTGKPKGVTLSHSNIVNNSNLIKHRAQYTENDMVCLSVPFYHCFGMVLGTLSMMNSGGCLLLPSLFFNAKKSIEASSFYGATTIFGVPTMFIEYLNVLENDRLTDSIYDISSLNKGLMAGSLCPEILLKRVQSEMELNEMIVGYGMTETSPLSFSNKPDDTFEKKTQTVGFIFPHTEARIVDKNRNLVKVGEEGELEVKGYCVMLGYYNNQKATDESIVDGWMKTGDICRMDKDMYVKVTGRSKDIIIRGGENVSPKEIEDKLLDFEEIENAQVIGVPDEKLGEEICALIKLKPNKTLDTKTIKSRLEHHLAHFKIPKYAKIVEDLPITVTGKPQKFVMRKLWNEEIEKYKNSDLYRIK